MFASLINVQILITRFKLGIICLGVSETKSRNGLSTAKIFQMKMFQIWGMCVFEQIVFLTLKYVLTTEKKNFEFNFYLLLNMIKYFSNKQLTVGIRRKNKLWLEQNIMLRKFFSLPYPKIYSSKILNETRLM